MARLTTEEKKEQKDLNYIREHYKGPILTRNQAIKARCLDCSADQRDEVTMCPATNCPLWPYRFGSNPFKKPREMSEKQKEAIKNRFSREDDSD